MSFNLFADLILKLFSNKLSPMDHLHYRLNFDLNVVKCDNIALRSLPFFSSYFVLQTGN